MFFRYSFFSQSGDDCPILTHHIFILFICFKKEVGYIIKQVIGCSTEFIYHGFVYSAKQCMFVFVDKIQSVVDVVFVVPSIDVTTAIVDLMLRDERLVVRGTDMDEYRTYQARIAGCRILKCGTTCVRAPLEKLEPLLGRMISSAFTVQGPLAEIRSV